MFAKQMRTRCRGSISAACRAALTALDAFIQSICRDEQGLRIRIHGQTREGACSIPASGERDESSAHVPILTRPDRPPASRSYSDAPAIGSGKKPNHARRGIQFPQIWTGTLPVLRLDGLKRPERLPSKWLGRSLDDLKVARMEQHLLNIAPRLMSGKFHHRVLVAVVRSA